MNTTPEALRLADLIESDFDPDWMYETGLDQISTELRRLHNENEALLDSCKAKSDRTDRLGEAVERLQAERYELLEALREAESLLVEKLHWLNIDSKASPTVHRIRAAIAKAEGRS